MSHSSDRCEKRREASDKELRVGVLLYGARGHVNPALPLLRELQNRGHHVFVYGFADTRDLLAPEDFTVHTLGEAHVPSGSLDQQLRQQVTGNISDNLRHLSRGFVSQLHAVTNDLPPLLKQHQLDILVHDQVVLGGYSSGEAAGVPVLIELACALPIVHSSVNPPIFLPAPARSLAVHRPMHLLQHCLLRVPVWNLVRVENRFRTDHGLSPKSILSLLRNRQRIISQLPAELDIPREKEVHYVGPMGDLDATSEDASNFPFEKLSDKNALVFATFGSVSGSVEKGIERLRNVSVAFANLELGYSSDLVIALGSSSAQNELPFMPGATIVSGYAPQKALLRRTSLLICHAGLNSVLEALAYGVPVLAIPYAVDQPQVASLLERSGAGIALHRCKDITQQKLASGMQRLLQESKYKKAAEQMQGYISKYRGARTAADLIERFVAGE
jgi:MGT family glycosyltransferase